MTATAFHITDAISYADAEPIVLRIGLFFLARSALALSGGFIQTVHHAYLEDISLYDDINSRDILIGVRFDQFIHIHIDDLVGNSLAFYTDFHSLISIPLMLPDSFDSGSNYCFIILQYLL